MVGRLVSKFLPQIAIERKLALTLIKLPYGGVYINKIRALKERPLVMWGSVMGSSAWPNQRQFP